VPSSQCSRAAHGVRRHDVRLYIKLPNWFEVDTPVGTYNSDWAIGITNLDEHVTNAASTADPHRQDAAVPKSRGESSI